VIFVSFHPGKENVIFAPSQTHRHRSKPKTNLTNTPGERTDFVSYYVGQRERRARLSAQVPPTKGTADLRDSSVEHAISAAATRSYMFRDMFQTCSNRIQILVRLP
jgi:hypothetical protein